VQIERQGRGARERAVIKRCARDIRAAALRADEGCAHERAVGEAGIIEGRAIETAVREIGFAEIGAA
jgi:hypothetical protein